VFTGITTFLLVEDLNRPKLFLTLLTRPNWKSWLVKGAWILIGFSLLQTAILGLHWFGADATAALLRWPAALLGAGVAGYTAFLFQQCEGRDLWQSPRLLPHLLVQALACGAVCFLPFVSTTSTWLAMVLLGSLSAHLMLALLERFGRHDTANARQAAAFLGTVKLGPFLALRDGLLLAVFLAVPLSFAFGPMALLLVLGGVFLYEWAYIRAGQLPPLS
jgi:hypothetical protein